MSLKSLLFKRPPPASVRHELLKIDVDRAIPSNDDVGTDSDGRIDIAVGIMNPVITRVVRNPSRHFFPRARNHRR